MAGTKIRIKLRAYDHRMLDVAARDIVDATSKTVQELQRLNLSAGVDIQIKL